MNTKVCTGECGQELPATLEFFGKQKGGKYGLKARCKKCLKEERKKYLEENKERIKESKKEYDKEYSKIHKVEKCKKAKEWYQQNKSRKSDYDKEYRKKNRIKIRNYKREYFKEYKKCPKNRAKLNAKNARRRERINSPEQWLGLPDNDLIIKIYEMRPKGYHVDHIISINNGGQHHQSNLCYLPLEINTAKGAKTIEEFGADIFNENVIYWQDLFQV